MTRDLDKRKYGGYITKAENSIKLAERIFDKVKTKLPK
jgi:hypothetical protein